MDILDQKRYPTFLSQWGLRNPENQTSLRVQRAPPIDCVVDRRSLNETKEPRALAAPRGSHRSPAEETGSPLLLGPAGTRRLGAGNGREDNDKDAPRRFNRTENIRLAHPADRSRRQGGSTGAAATRSPSTVGLEDTLYLGRGTNVGHAASR